MEYLKGEFDDELSAEINDDGDVNIAGYPFKPDIILKEIDPTIYDEVFNEWLDKRKKNLLTKADEILGLYDNQSRFNRLKEAYKRGAVIPFIGAGMSIPSGYPGWTKFLQQHCNETRVREEDLNHLLSQGKYEEAAQALADDMSPVSFDEAIENVFEHDNDLVGPIQLLPSIFNTSVITTNFDTVIKRCYDNSESYFTETLLGADAKELPRYLGRGDKVLVKLHGKANSNRNRVLTYSEYEEHYGDPSCLQNTIEAISTKTLLFLGCSLVIDRTIHTLTQLVMEKGHEVATRHYAFLSIREDEDRLARKNDLIKANIFPIWYPADEGHDKCIEALLLKLKEGG